MTVWAYCGQDWLEATAHAAGRIPYVSPSHNSESIGRYLHLAATADIVYLNLHGYAGEPNFFGQFEGAVGPTALSPATVERFDWSNCVVFAEVCFSAQNGGGPIARAFLENGAQAFIGSVGEAYGRARPSLLDGEADRLFWLFRKFYPLVTERPAEALEKAKQLLALTSFPLDGDDRATIEGFVCLTR